MVARQGTDWACLRKRYPVSQLPPRLLTLVKKLEAAEGSELDPAEDSQLALA